MLTCGFCRFAEKAPTSGLAACLHLSRTAASPQVLKSAPFGAAVYAVLQVAVHLGRLLGTRDRGEPLRARQVLHRLLPNSASHAIP